MEKGSTEVCRNHICAHHHMQAFAQNKQVQRVCQILSSYMTACTAVMLQQGTMDILEVIMMVLHC